MIAGLRTGFRVLAALLVTIAVSVEAQSAPSTDIFLARINHSSPELELGAPLNITSRAGYDNQPSFTPDGRAIFYTRIGDDAQAEIFRYDIGDRRATRITSTAESEYSPQMVPAGDAISVVRVEADSTQRLWRFSLSRGEPQPIFPAIAPVGYYAWADSSSLAMFVLGNPPELRLGDVKSGQAKVIARGVGRSIHRVPGRRAVSFVDKSKGDDNDWWICVFDLDTEDIERLTATLPQREDYAWLPDGSLLMAEDSTLFRWSASSGGWREVVSFSAPNLANISRLAVSPRGDWLAIVASAAQRE